MNLSLSLHANLAFENPTTLKKMTITKIQLWEQIKDSRDNLAIIGSGATAVYLLKHLSDNMHAIGSRISTITIFEKSVDMGTGMPYSPYTTDIHNLANISSEEIPELPETFGDWLRGQNHRLLGLLNVTEFPIDDSKVYSRLAIGCYLQTQYKLLVRKLRMVMGTFSRFLFYKVTKIIWGKVLLLSKITYRRCSEFLGLPCFDIGVQRGSQIYQTSQTGTVRTSCGFQRSIRKYVGLVATQ